jgi:hypothetical protein
MNLGDGNDSAALNAYNLAFGAPVMQTMNLGGGDDNAMIIYGNVALSAEAVTNVMGGAGDDRVTATFQQPPEPEFVLRTDLGLGNDTFDAVLTQPPEPERPGEVQPPDPDAPVGVSIEVLGDAGDDQVNVTFFDILSDADVRVDLGAGDDTFQGTVAIADLGGSVGPAPTQIDPGNFSVNLDVFGRSGRDVLGLQVGGPQPHLLNSDLAVNFDGGDGADTARIDISNTAVTGSLKVNVQGGTGGDTVGFVVIGGTVAAGAAVDLSASGGGGGDALSIGGFMPCALPGSRLAVSLAGDGGNDTIDASLAFPDPAGGEVGIIIIGGFGDDHIRADVMPCSVPGGIIDVTIGGDDGNDVIAATLRDAHVDGQFNLNMTGGAGADDLFIGGTMPCLESEARSSIHLSGDAGNDTIRGDLQTDADSQGITAIIIDGGLEDDDLTLLIAGSGDPNLVRALVDGGAGYDVAHVTRGVGVEDCEEVVLVG